MKRAKKSPSRTNFTDKFRRQILVGWVFALIWLLFVGAFDVFLVWTAARQLHAARTWTTVPAVVTSSEVVTSRGRKGKSTHRPSVTYAYTVSDREYTGSTIDAFALVTSGRSYAEGATGAFPKGATVEVHVHPDDPAQSALRVGVQPASVRFLLFAMPFNAVLLGLIPFLVRARSYASDPTLGWLVVDEPDRAVVRCVHWEPWTLGCLAMGVASFVGIFVTMVASKGDPPFEYAAGAAGGSVVVGLVLYAWRRGAVSSGRYDVEFDRRLRRVTLPRSGQHFERSGFRFDQLQVEIEVDPNRRINREPTWMLRLRPEGTPDSDPGIYTVYWLERPIAKMLGRWVARECGVRLSTRQPASEPPE